MVEFLLQHQFAIAVAAYWIFSAAVSALPEPASYRTGASRPEPAGGSACYLWLYRFCHTTAGNLTTVFGSRIPGLRILVPVLIVPLLLSNTACAAAHYTVHPGALNTVDSAAYDTLIAAQAAIDQARSDYKAGRLPAGARDALNMLVRAYNASHDAWIAYRGAVSTNVPSDVYFTQLNKNILDLSNAIRALREVR
jgi:hypothetical protein